MKHCLKISLYTPLNVFNKNQYTPEESRKPHCGLWVHLEYAPVTFYSTYTEHTE